MSNRSSGSKTSDPRTETTSNSTTARTQSSIVIKNSNINNKSSAKALDLNITRRPLSPVHNLEPNKLIIKRSNIQSTPANTTTMEAAARTSDNISNPKNKPIQIEPRVIKTKQSDHPSQLVFIDFSTFIWFLHYYMGLYFIVPS